MPAEVSGAAASRGGSVRRHVLPTSPAPPGPDGRQAEEEHKLNRLNSQTGRLTKEFSAMRAAQDTQSHMMQQMMKCINGW
eukprot:66521-Pyramimonas_sp.AAC.1